MSQQVESNKVLKPFRTETSTGNRSNMCTFHERKQLMIQDLTQCLIDASIISVKQASQYLEVQIARSELKNMPTNVVFYDYATLFNINQHILRSKYPELIGLKKNQGLPKYLEGEFKLNPITTINNRRYFITPIVRKTEELGFEKIYIDSGGIHYHLKREDLGPLALSYFEITDQLIQNCRLDLQDVLARLEELVEQPNSAPTHGAFFSYVKLLAGKTSLPEIATLSGEDSTLPDKVGLYQLPIGKVFENEEHFISKIVRYAKEIGFEGANVSPNGITYYVVPEKMGPKASKLYNEFFLGNVEIQKLIQDQRSTKHYKSDHLVVKTFPKYYSNPQVQRINYELRKHYNKIGYSVNLSYDWRYEVEGEPLVLKIYTDGPVTEDYVEKKVSSGPKLSNMSLLKPRSSKPSPSPFPK